MTNKTFGLLIGTIAAWLILGLITMALLWQPLVGPWLQKQQGVAELIRAEQNRKIKTLEAQARLEAARHLAEAEIKKANGAAQAIVMMSESLGGTEGYLRWKYIEMLEETGLDSNTVIYIPTEAGMPILEAGRVSEMNQ